MKTILLWLLLVTSAHAQTVGLHLFSAHEQPGMNNTNPGVYVRLDNGLTLGTYFNSVRKQSAYAGWTFETPEWNRLTAAITIGAVTGYATKVTALAVPSAAFHTEPVTVRVGIIPRPPVKGGSGALSLMIEHHF